MQEKPEGKQEFSRKGERKGERREKNSQIPLVNGNSVLRTVT